MKQVNVKMVRKADKQVLTERTFDIDDSVTIVYDGPGSKFIYSKKSTGDNSYVDYQVWVPNEEREVLVTYL